MSRVWAGPGFRIDVERVDRPSRPTLLRVEVDGRPTRLHLDEAGELAVAIAQAVEFATAVAWLYEEGAPWPA